MNHLIYYLTFACAVGSGLLAGIFFAFSTFIMTSLSRLPEDKSIPAMQSINAVIVRSWFIVLFMGMTVLCLILGVVSFTRLGTPSAVYALTGSLLIIVGSFLVTAVFNVPLNNRLASVTPGTETAKAWKHYTADWVPWNHVRTIASLAAMIAFIIALRVW